MASGYAYKSAPGCGERSPDGAKAGRGSWDGRCDDPSLSMFRRAFSYAVERGLRSEFMPELRSENGVLHAYRHDGTKLRLEPCPEWEDRTGFASLVEDLRKVQESSDAPLDRRGSGPPVLSPLRPLSRRVPVER